jgi:molybdopterin synthase catalytic subunit
MSFKITSAVIDPVARKQELTRSTAGACVTFEGWVRDHNDADMDVRGRATQGAVARGEAVQALEYEAHQAIAEKEGTRIVAEAMARFAVTAVLCEHRVGKLSIGDCAVWVGVSADHRGAAFDACRYVIDETKARVPIWKKEYYASGATAWVNCATRPAG